MNNVLKQMQKEIDAGNFPGCVAAAGHKNGEMFCCASGLAERQPVSRVMCTDSIFDLASVTKPVATATAVGVLLENGCFEIDSFVAELLPEYAQFFPAGLRIRHLVTHSSGFDNAKPADGLAGEAALTDWLSKPATAVPGRRFLYACKNSVLLSLIVEKCSGRDFAGYCRDKIFIPLGMHDTCFGPLPFSHRLVKFQHCIGQIDDGPAAVIGRPVGNAGLFSTVSDLSRFSRMLLNNGKLEGIRVLQPGTVEFLTKNHAPAGLPRHGICWFIGPAADEYHRHPAGLSGSCFGHLGWTGQSLWIDPERELFLIVLTNRVHAAGFADIQTRTEFLLKSNMARVRVGEALLDFV